MNLHSILLLPSNTDSVWLTADGQRLDVRTMDNRHITNTLNRFGFLLIPTQAPETRSPLRRRVWGVYHEAVRRGLDVGNYVRWG